MDNDEQKPGYVKWVTTLSLSAILIADLWWVYSGKKGHMIEGPDLVLIGFIVFILFGDRIVKLAITTKGLTLQQTAQVARLQMQNILSLKDNASTKKILSVLNEATGQEANVWARLMIYRLSLRMILRRTVEHLGMQTGDAPSIQKMLEFVAPKDIFSKNAFEKMERLRQVSYYFEWGIEPSPTLEEIESVLRDAPDLLRRIAEKAEQVIKTEQVVKVEQEKTPK